MVTDYQASWLHGECQLILLTHNATLEYLILA